MTQPSKPCVTPDTIFPNRWTTIHGSWLNTIASCKSAIRIALFRNHAIYAKRRIHEQPRLFFLPSNECGGVPLCIWTTCWLVGRALVRGAVSRGRLLTAYLTPAVVPVCILIVGVAFVRPEYTAWPTGTHPPIPWFKGVPADYQQAAITALHLIQLPVGLCLCYWSRPEWPGVVATSIWWACVSVCASIMAEMSITGNWL